MKEKYIKSEKRACAIAYMESTVVDIYMPFLFHLPPSTPDFIVLCHVSPSISKTTPNKFIF